MDVNNKKVITTKNAPQAIGVYSQGIESNNFVCFEESCLMSIFARFKPNA